MSPMIISLAAFFAATMLIVGVAALMGMFNTSKAEDRLAVMTGRKKELESEGIVKEELFREGRAGLAGVLSGLGKRLEGMSRLFQQADCPLKPEMFFGVMGVCGCLGFAAMALTHAALPLLASRGALMGLPRCP